MLRRRQLMAMQKNEELPVEYRKVEYIQSLDYSTYIDTGVQIASDVEMEMKINLTRIENGRYLFGRYISNAGDFFMYTSAGGSGGYFQTAYGCTYNNTTKKADTLIHTFRFNISSGLTYVYCDGTQVLSKAALETFPERSIYVAGTAMNNASIPCNTYSVRISKGGTPIRNFVPCVRKFDGKSGMYDTVSKTFFTSAGTGEFITPTVWNLCPAATGTEIAEKWGLSNSYRRYMLTGLDPNQDYTLQATWTRTWDTSSNRRLYLNGITTTAMIRPTSQDTVAPFTKYVTTKPSAEGTLEISANNTGLTSEAIDGPEYAASMVNIMLEIGSIAHPFVQYIGP